MYYLYFQKSLKKVFYNQLRQYLEKYLNSLLCRFQKAHSSQNILFNLLQTWQEELDKSGFLGTILIGSSKSYGSLSTDILVSKYEAYGIDENG